MGYFYADDYIRSKRYDPYSSIASDPEIQVDEKTFKDLTPTGNRSASQETKKKKIIPAV